MKLFICILAMMATAMADDTDVEKRFTVANNQFANKMFTEVANSKPGQSVVMSAFSAMSPLAMLGLASVGISHDELLQVMGLPNDNATKEVFAFVSQRLRSVKGVDLKVANRVFVPQGVELNEDYAAVSREVFQSDVKQVDFSKNVEAAATINTWVEDNTNKRIKDLVSADSLDSDTRAVLVNAIYFKGSWMDKFDPKRTSDRDFHVTKDKTIQVPTMYKNSNFKYGYSEELNAKLLELFYEGEEASFLIVLPDEIDGIQELENKLKDPSLLEKAVQSMYSTEVDVYLPKFKIETTINLKEVLQKIGVKNLFDPSNARLEKLLKGEGNGLYVSDAIQKAFIEVNEEGAEAAAGSAYRVYDRSGVVTFKPNPEFKADRPYIFLLQQKSITLFTGVFSLSA